jgi:hypothetical protein
LRSRISGAPLHHKRVHARLRALWRRIRDTCGGIARIVVRKNLNRR